MDNTDRYEYHVLQDLKRVVFTGKTKEECDAYIKEVKEAYDDDYGYILRYNERDGTLTFQSVATGLFVTSLNTRIYDKRLDKYCNEKGVILLS